MHLKSTVTLLTVQCLIGLITAVQHPNVAPTTFCYDEASCGASTWGGVCKAGREQSPIDIPLIPSQQYRPTLFKLNEHYLFERPLWFYAQNNGHTAQFELRSNTSNLSSDLLICGGHLGACYKFAQLHFHWAEHDWEGSEHAVNGVKHPLELHLVHHKTSYMNLAAALASDDREAVAVMAVFFEIGRKDDVFLGSVIRALSSLRTPGEVMEFHMPLKIADLYPPNGEFAHYEGSLTTPTCDEKVVWTVFLRPQEISEKQIKQFRLISNGEGNSDFNFRPLQPRHGRQIEYYRSSGFTETSVVQDVEARIDEVYGSTLAV